MSVEDSSNSAGVVVDAIRCAKLALERGLAGPLEAPSAYYMKSPPRQLRDSVARDACNAFIDGDPFELPDQARSARIAVRSSRS
jgi:myo-inositol-1-phosphate synthase